ncbi:peptidase [Achlya hypogyna]|uniref:Peptidase n=1 Tax=Achlya hypogyna TaxID=1202772 RepID=A0A1V9YMX5_ACHHY|nr:peptidase [Achlya hypogyna]
MFVWALQVKAIRSELKLAFLVSMRGAHVALIAAVVAAAADACTVIGVTHGASADGSSLLAHTDDAGGGTADTRLIRVPAMDHAPGAMRDILNVNGGYPRIISKTRGPLYEPVHGQTLMTPLGTIPQVNHTYAYFDQDYGMMNEVALSIAESTCPAKTVGWPSDVPYGYNMMGIGELTKIALERCDSARCAIQLMGDLAVEHGFYSEDSGDPKSPMYCDSAEALAISDKYGEMWVFHVLTGPKNASAVWAAQRVPDGHVTVLANAFSIRHMDLNDTNNFLASPNVLSFALKMGWYNPADGPFDFSAAYSWGDVTGYAGSILPLYAGRRLWRVLDAVAPSLELDATLGWQATTATYPFSVKPDGLVNITDVFRLLRDHYEGTPYDMTKGLGAGPFGNPIRFDGPFFNVSGGWERSISMYRTMFAFVLQIQDATDLSDAMRATAWYCQDSPHGSVFVPLAPTQTALPPSYTTGNQSVFNTDSAWWAFNFVNQWSMLRWNTINGEVRANVARLEETALQLHASLLARDRTANGTLAPSVVQDAFYALATDVVAEWWALAWRLVAKYSCGYVVLGEGPGKMSAPGYSREWLAATEFNGWPGATYQDPKAPSPPTTSEVIEDPKGPSRTMGPEAIKVADAPPMHASGGSKSNIVEIVGYMIMGACLALGSHALIAQQKRRDGYAPLQ